MSEAKTNPVLNIDDVPLMDFGNGQKFAARLGRIGPLLGAPPGGEGTADYFEGK